MQLLYKYPFIFYTGLLVLGILLSPFFSILYLLIFGFFSLFLLFFKERVRFVGVFFLIVLLGVLLPKLKQKPSSAFKEYDESIYTVEVVEKRSYQNFDQLLVEIVDHPESRLNGNKVLISSSGFYSVHSGDLLLLRSKLNLINKPSIPDQFSFKKYNARRGVFHQAYLYNSESVKKIGEVHGANYYLQKLRNHLGDNISNTFPNPEVEGVLRSLVVGDKSHLLKEQKNDYTTSGVIHVLAVSGLHVGLFYLLLSFVLDLWVRNKWLFVTLLALGLLLYAGLTGFSPSVIRASVMFFIFGLAKALKRGTSSVNVLFISSFFILLFKPSYLYEPGFQLSFTAVLGILTCTSYVSGLLDVKSKLLNAIWKGLSVSFVAQLFTAPLIIYYFHQFPVYFLMTNLLVVFLIQFILISGMIIGVFGDVIGMKFIAEKCVLFINYVTHWFSSLPFSKLDGLWVSPYQVGVLYFLIICFFLFWIKRKRVFALGVVVFLSLFWGMTMERKMIHDQQEYISFHKLGKSLIVENTSSNSSILNVMTTPQEEFKIEKAFSSYWSKRNISDVKIIQDETICVIKGKSVGVIRDENELFFDFNLFIKGRSFFVYNGLGEQVFSSKSEESLTILE